MGTVMTDHSKEIVENNHAITTPVFNLCLCLKI
jgi:hypothetical protein